MKKKILCLIFIIIFGIGAFADSITIACSQNKDLDELCKIVTQEFEDTLFEPFFDAGFIVTGIPIAEIESKKELDLSILAQKLEEPTDYILIAYLKYNKAVEFNAKLNKKIAKWEKLSISFIDLNTKKELYKKDVDLNKIKELDPEKKAQKLSIEITKQIINIIKQGKGA